MMKKIITIILLIGFLSSVSAQNWLTNFDEVKKIAIKENKKIIMSFQGSDWCAPCIKLEREFFSQKEFIAYSKKHVVLLKVDFPKKKAHKLSKEQTNHNNLLAKKYNNNGNFPLIVVIDNKGNVLKKMGYKSISVEEFIRELSSN
jgi:thioredoxin-related protein